MIDLDEDITYEELETSLNRYCGIRKRAVEGSNRHQDAILLVRYIREVRRMWKESERLTLENGRLLIRLREKEAYQKAAGARL